LKKYTSDKILKGLLENDRDVVDYVYNNYFNAIKNFVLNYGGTKEDAWDIFQDSIMVIYDQAKEGDLQIKTSFMTYLLTISKYRWFKLIRDGNKKFYETVENNFEVEKAWYLDNASELDEAFEKEERVKLFIRHYQRLSESCQEMLKLVAQGVSVKELTAKFGYKSKGFTYKKRRTCKERLIKMINEEINTNRN
jgi:DNA-directed RNA polymerase specialized sigma24 family protein